jgi:glycosyltransferase involved in cell wall biosynthesis
MRIGIMLRAYDRPGGIGIYSRNIIQHLLRLNRENQYLLLYNNPAHVGTYAHLPNVEEQALPSANQILWDQVLAARALSRWRADLVFNTKFSLPLALKAKKVMVLHGATWYTHPHMYPWHDIAYVRLAMPVYCRAADFLISNSELTTTDFKRIVKVPPAKIETVLLAAADHFKLIQDHDALAQVRAKYSLPERFILTVTSYENERKNFSGLLEAFIQCREQHPGVRLLVVGKNCQRYATDFGLAARGLGEAVIFPGWVDQADLPAIYNLAAAFAFPSIYEEFGIPVVEAMACGCPVAGANTGALPELTQGAALLSDPKRPDLLARSLIDILSSPDTAKRLREQGLQRAKDFSWAESARKTLDIFQRVHLGEAAA